MLFRSIIDRLTEAKRPFQADHTDLAMIASIYFQGILPFGALISLTLCAAFVTVPLNFRDAPEYYMSRLCPP